MPDPRTFGIILISIGVLLIAALYILYRKREKGVPRAKAVKEAQGPLLLLNLEEEERRSSEEPVSGRAPEGSPAAEPDAEEKTAPEQAPWIEAAAKEPVSKTDARPPAFETLQGQARLWGDFLRALLIVLSLATAAGLVLAFLPQTAVDGMALRLRARHGGASPEKIAFLYLGDELSGSTFRIRGVVRNITPAPIEQLDASLRFYAHDRSILETAVVRLDKEVLAPGEVGQFELVYPNYRMEFGSYSVEFKLRRGPLVPYRDMRKTRSEPVQ